MPISLERGYTTLGIFSVVLLLLMIIDLLVPRLFINLSPSAPYGIWQQYTDNVPLARGDWVVACPNLDPVAIDALILRPGRNPDECVSAAHLKKVAALPGDKVRVYEYEIQTPIATVHALRHRHDGVELPRVKEGVHIVERETLWLINDHHPFSVDSRYYGPLSTDDILRRAKPILTLGSSPT